MSVITKYLASLNESDRSAISPLYNLVRQLVPNATEELSYGMPAFKYHGKGLVSIMVTKKHLSLYPFSGQTITSLHDRLKDFECTSGSIHFSADKSLSPETLRAIIETRLAEIG